MTERYNYLVVVLETDTRGDDANPTMDAIRQIKGVMSVTGNVADADALLAFERAKRDLEGKLWEVLYPKVKP